MRCPISYGSRTIVILYLLVLTFFLAFQLSLLSGKGTQIELSSGYSTIARGDYSYRRKLGRGAKDSFCCNPGPLTSTSFLSLSYNEARKTLFLGCAIALSPVVDV